MPYKTKRFDVFTFYNFQTSFDMTDSRVRFFVRVLRCVRSPLQLLDILGDSDAKYKNSLALL